MREDEPSLPPGSDLGSRTVASRARFERTEDMVADLERELAAKGWPDDGLEGVADMAQVDVRYWRAEYNRLQSEWRDSVVRQAGHPDDIRISDQLLRAWTRYTIAKFAIDAMRDALRNAELRGESPNRPACEAFFNAWRVYPILNGSIMTADWASPEQRDRAIVVLSGWLSRRVKEGVSPELDAALRDADSPFVRALCERLPASVVEAWHELPVDERTAETLVRLSTNLLRREGRLKKVKRPDGTYERVTPESVSDIDLGNQQDELDSFVLLEESKQAVRDLLSPREAEVYQLLLEDCDYPEIARRLAIREATVRVMALHIREKVRAAGLST